MKELIKIQTNENGVQCVSARELHEKLILEEGKEERFSQWFKRHLQYGFEENIDFTSVKIFTVVNNGAKRELIDYATTIDMAKELCMLQKSDKGREFRKYFIECEKKLKEVKEIGDKQTKHYEKKKIFNDESPLLMEGKKSDTIYNNFKNNTVRKELERVIDKTGIKVTNIAKAINISDSNMSDFRNNKINFNDEKLELIVNILDSAKGLLLLL